MLRFLLLTLTLCLGCALAIGAAVVVGRTQPPLEVGNATYAEVKRYLASYMPSGNYRIEISETTRGDYQEIRLTITDKKDQFAINFVTFRFYNGLLEQADLDGRYFKFLPTLKDVVAQYGTPTCAFETDPSQNDSRRAVVIVDESRSLIITAGGFYGMGWDDKVLDLRISVKQSNDNPCKCNFWRGVDAYYPMNCNGTIP